MMKVAHPPHLTEGWCLRVQISLGLWRNKTTVEHLWSPVSHICGTVDLGCKPATWKCLEGQLLSCGGQRWTLQPPVN